MLSIKAGIGGCRLVPERAKEQFQAASRQLQDWKPKSQCKKPMLKQIQHDEILDQRRTVLPALTLFPKIATRQKSTGY